ALAAAPGRGVCPHRKRTERTGQGSETRRSDVVLQTADGALDVYIVVNTLAKKRANSSEELRLLPRNPSANQDPLRRHTEHQRVRKLCERKRHDIPDRAIDGERPRWRTRTSFNGRSGREPLHTRAVKPTMSGPGVAREARRTDVSKFGMMPADKWFAARYQSHSHSRTDRNIGVVTQPLRCAPAAFGQRSTNYVGRDPDGGRKAARKESRDIHILPARLRGHTDLSKVGRFRTKLERPKACDPDA